MVRLWCLAELGCVLVMRDYPWLTNGSLRSLSHFSWILCLGVVFLVQSTGLGGEIILVVSD